MQQPTIEQIQAKFPGIEGEKLSTLQRSSYVSPSGTLCMLASRVSTVGVATKGRTLPTAVSPLAASVLFALRELFDVGLITASGVQLHDRAPGVTVLTESK